MGIAYGTAKNRSFFSPSVKGFISLMKLETSGLHSTLIECCRRFQSILASVADRGTVVIAFIEIALLHGYRATFFERLFIIRILS